MKRIAILVTGDRNATMPDWWETLATAFDRILDQLSDNDPVILIHGAARGIDSLAEQYFHIIDGVANEAYPADWNAHGRAAGPIRNKAMLDRLLALRDQGYEPRVIAFHDAIKTSKGTGGMCRMARNAGLNPLVYSSNGECKPYSEAPQGP